MNEKVLLTGGAGYLGNVLSRDLLSRGYRVSCVDNLMYNQGSSIFPLVANPNYEFVFGDVRDSDLIKRKVRESDVIIPLAAIVGEPACRNRPIEARTVNTDAIRYIDSILSRDQRIICPITNSGYGTRSGEDFCTEETPLEPISLYGKTKVEAERVLLDSDKDSITLRLATVFGVSPRMRRDLLVNDFVYQALTNKSIVLFEPHFKRNFVHISDVSGAFVYAMEHFDSMKNEAYNVGIDSANMSKLELAEKVKTHIPKFEVFISETGEDPDKRDYIVSNEKLRKKGFEAKVNLDSGIEELIRGYNVLLRNLPHTNL
jgi:nucleoside-diphosphate-sugar epimerase